MSTPGARKDSGFQRACYAAGMALSALFHLGLLRLAPSLPGAREMSDSEARALRVRLAPAAPRVPSRNDHAGSSSRRAGEANEKPERELRAAAEVRKAQRPQEKRSVRREKAAPENDRVASVPRETDMPKREGENGRAVGRTGAPGRPRADGPSQAAQRDPVAVLLEELRRKLEERKRYPRLALRYGLEGTVLLEARIRPSGFVEGWGIVRRSPHPLLDDAALEAARGIRKLDSAVPGRTEPVLVLVPLHFRVVEER
ncbi:MAG: hypothetical protein KatS3mg076_2953 [Candidatus Binatia bacterium]|nr:MAG: hypothetical protein KatS3mg076_2953 [Candidatus Binatia bacterium]